ncbi:DNA methylase [Treponema sp. OMZ 305]|uniref:DNA methylase n=1 Tax=Treponema sp. OMZ 305 TaxID=1659192 RepID=UPI0020A3F968|nr:DNA methylase [Treponema sp. OMZ 305]
MDKLYRKVPFPDDASRVAFLFELYGKKTEGLLTGKRKRGKLSAYRNSYNDE